MIKFFFDLKPMLFRDQNLMEIVNETNLLFFNYAMLRFLRDARSELRAAGLISELVTSGRGFRPGP